MRTRTKANLAVAISIGGCFATLPFAETGLAGGLIHHGFLAAAVGGLADWFAVTAIFGKPLGISYRTDILRRNRQRITGGLVDFASDDLLKPDNILNVLAKEDFAQLLLDYLKLRGGMPRVEQFADTILAEVLKRLDTDKIAEKLEPCFRDVLLALPINDLWTAGVKELNSEEARKIIINDFCNVMRNLIKCQDVQNLLRESVDNILHDYSESGFGRGMLLSSLGLDTESVMLQLQEQAENFLIRLNTNEDSLHQSLDERINNYVNDLASNENLIEMLKDNKNKKLKEFCFKDYIKEILAEKLCNSSVCIAEKVKILLDERLSEFEKSEKQRSLFNSFIYNWIEEKIKLHSRVIPQIMQEQLDRFSDDELVEMAENRVEDDLQMIRINGAVVGSVAGMLLYLLKYIVFGGPDL